MKIVFIGHTGFIGKSIYHHLSLSNQFNLKGISSKEVDLTKKHSDKSLLKNISPNCVVIMCAGLKKQLGDNLESFDSNLKIMINFSKAISKSQPKKIIFFSSASVYGEDVDHTEIISEKTAVKPRTYYGIGKFTNELLLTKVCADKGIKLLILRPPLVYGKNDQSRGYGPTGFVYKVLNGEEIVIWGDGNEFREFIYVEDLGSVAEMLIKNDTTGVLNLVSGKSYRFREIIDLLNAINGKESKFVFRKRTKKKVNHHYSNALINNELGNFKFTNLKDGLEKTQKEIIEIMKDSNELRP